MISIILRGKVSCFPIGLQKRVLLFLAMSPGLFLGFTGGFVKAHLDHV
jgi:hypothetical protein